MSCSGMASGQHVKRSTVVRRYLKLSDVVSGPKISMCTCWNREVDREKSPSGVVVCQDTFDRWQYWHARAQVRQSCTPGHTNRWEMSFPVALVPRWSRPWRESNTCCRRVAGTYGRGLVEDVSHCRDISQPVTWIFSNRRAVVPCKRLASSASIACASSKASGETDVHTASTRDRA